MHWCLACIYVCVRVTDSLELELQTTVRCHEGAGNWTQVLWKNSEHSESRRHLSRPRLFFWVLSTHSCLLMKFLYGISSYNLSVFFFAVLWSSWLCGLVSQSLFLQTVYSILSSCFHYRVLTSYCSCPQGSAMPFWLSLSTILPFFPFIIFLPSSLPPWTSFLLTASFHFWDFQVVA